METTRRIAVNGIEIREQVIGDGEPVLMIHGWGANGDLLLPLAREMVGCGYRLMLPDLPGFGESDEPPTPFSIFDYADFCLAYLRHHKLERVSYFGHSFGGRIGLILGADHKERIRSMALSNSAGIKAPTPLLNRSRLSIYRAARQSLEKVGAGAAAEKLREIYNRRYASPDFAAASPVMRQTLVKVVNQDLLDWAKRVAAPTLLIWGDADGETPLWIGQTLEEAIPDAALIVRPGAGHYAYLDNPRETAAIMHALYQSASQ